MPKWRCTVCGADHPYLPDRCENCGNPAFEKFATKKEYRRKQKLRRGLGKSKQYTLKAGKYLAIGAFVFVALLAVALVVMEPSLLISDTQSSDGTGPQESDGILDRARDGAHDVINQTTGEQFDRKKIEQRIHYYVNQERSEEGLPPLSFDRELQEIARGHSRDMAEEEYFSHISLDGVAVEGRYENAGYDCEIHTETRGRTRIYQTGGENIAQSYWQTQIATQSGETVFFDTNDGIARGIVNQWMNSSGHRENLLQEYWRNEGIGVYKDGDAVYATQNFC